MSFAEAFARHSSDDARTTDQMNEVTPVRLIEEPEEPLNEITETRQNENTDWR